MRGLLGWLSIVLAGHVAVVPTVSAQTIDVQGVVAHLTGDITEDLPEKIAALPDGVRVLVLTSTGGYTAPAFEAAKDIRARNLTTYVPEFCFSACTMLFQAGSRRVIGVQGSLMFHASRPPNGEFDYWVGRIYARYGLDEEFVGRFNGGGDHTLAPDQAITVGAATQIGEP
ncbi:MAG: hypothetical protein VR70_07045 [Rhodospirillaceae bacterium BRH_c57]|nr:MAG: hypothetical protein VR70_07045 [Rhodospirillaceae bacterium BRH_c57]